MAEGIKQSAVDPAENFNNHLDKCKQCRDHPFALCAAGDKLLKQTVLEIKRS